MIASIQSIGVGIERFMPETHQKGSVRGFISFQALLRDSEQVRAILVVDKLNTYCAVTHC